MFISLTFRTKAFLDESNDLVFLDTRHQSFPLQLHRDEKSFFRAILSAKKSNVFTISEYFTSFLTKI